ncbi:hypothetical protein [Ruegeria arenilitoris]|uniref:hypothetical protein n=1 Tax=Ruegeria arenilitoris TaxID=1173585 RepID=UPI00147B3CAF|nr:hypothetical protein [Ruegeria arenilitoris]
MGVWPEGAVIADKLAKLFVYFVIGAYASEWIRTHASNALPTVIVLCAAGFGVLVVLAASFDLQNVPLVLFKLPALSVAAIIGAIVLASHAGRAQWMGLIGSHSHYLSLTHFLSVTGTRIILTKIVGVTKPLFVIPICVAVAVVFGIAFCRILTGTRFEWLIRLPKWLSERRYDLPVMRSPSA